MDMAILLHLAGDESAAERVAARFPGVRMMRVAVEPRGAAIAFGPHLPLLFVWTEQAERSAMRLSFAAIARAHAGVSLIASGDGAAAPEGFAAPLAADETNLAAAVAAASGSPAEPKVVAAGKSFAIGMARGIFGGAAVMGVGGIAIAASGQIEQPLVEPVAITAAATVEAAPLAETPAVIDLAPLSADEPLIETTDAADWVEVASAVEASPIKDVRVAAPAPDLRPITVDTLEAAPLEELAPIAVEDFVLVSGAITQVAADEPAEFAPEGGWSLRNSAMSAIRRL